MNTGRLVNAFILLSEFSFSNKNLVLYESFPLRVQSLPLLFCELIPSLFEEKKRFPCLQATRRASCTFYSWKQNKNNMCSLYWCVLLTPISKEGFRRHLLVNVLAGAVPLVIFCDHNKEPINLFVYVMS